MKIFFVHNSDLISPFEEPARDSWLLDRTVGESMERELLSTGLVIESAHSFEEAEKSAQQERDGAYIIADSVVCSRLVLQGFIKLAKQQKGDVSLICSLPRGLATDLMSHLNGLDPAKVPDTDKEVWTAPFYFIRGNGSIDKAEPLVLPYKERVVHYKIPVGFVGRNENIHSMSNSYICNINHWVHLLRVNYAAVLCWWFDRLRSGFWFGGISWYLWRFIMGFPWINGRLTEGIRSVSFKARVHHSACIDFSIVQKGAKIGTNVIIQNSFIAEGADIADGAMVINSIVGKGAYVARNAIVFSSLLYPGAFAGQFLMQFSVLGKDSCAFTNSGFLDINFKKNIRVLHRGNYADIGTQYLGVCLGPQARVSAGVWVASGREVPKGTLLVMPPENIASSFDKIEPGEPAVIHNGKVVQLQKNDQQLPSNIELK